MKNNLFKQIINMNLLKNSFLNGFEIYSFLAERRRFEKDKEIFDIKSEMLKCMEVISKFSLL